MVRSAPTLPNKKKTLILMVNTENNYVINFNTYTFTGRNKINTKSKINWGILQTTTNILKDNAYTSGMRK